MAPSTDTTEKGLEVLIVSHLTGLSTGQVERPQRDGTVAELPVACGSGWASRMTTTGSTRST